MKKVKKSFQDVLNSKIKWDQLSQLKGGDIGFSNDLLVVPTEPYQVAEPNESGRG